MPVLVNIKFSDIIDVIDPLIDPSKVKKTANSLNFSHG